MLIAFFDRHGMVYQHLVPSKVTVNAAHYLTVLRTLEQHVLKKRPHLKKQCILHQDNARPHTARIITDYLEKIKIRVMPHPPYSPDEAPCNFYLFPFLKKEGP